MDIEERIDCHLRDHFPEMVANAVESDDGGFDYLISVLSGYSDERISSMFSEIAEECTGAVFDQWSGLRPGENHPAVVIANRVYEFGLT